MAIHPEKWEKVRHVSAFGVEFKLMEEEDIPLMCRWRNDPDILPFMEDTRPAKPRAVAVWLRMALAQKTALPYIVYWQGEPAAYYEIKDVDYRAKSYATGEFYYGLEHTGSGLCYRAGFCRLLISKMLGLKRCIFRVKAINKKAIRRAREFGWRLIGQEGDDLVYGDGNQEAKLKAMAKVVKLLHLEDEFSRWFGARARRARAHFERFRRNRRGEAATNRRDLRRGRH